MAGKGLIDPDINIYSAEAVKELADRIDRINAAVNGSEKNFIKIAFNLYWIYATRAYRSMGCESVTDFALKQFSFAKTTTYSYITIVERFGIHDETGKLAADDIDPAYKDYSTSKLSVISGLSDEEIKSLGITPGMTVRDIKKAVKAHNKGLSLPPSGKPGSPLKGQAGSSKEGQQQEMEIDGSNTVVLPSGSSGGDDAAADGTTFYSSGTYFSFNKKDMTTGRVGIVDIGNILKGIFGKHPDASIEISYRYPVKAEDTKGKGGKRK